jgi:hypothetical protein
VDAMTTKPRFTIYFEFVFSARKSGKRHDTDRTVHGGRVVLQKSSGNPAEHGRRSLQLVS